MNPVSHVCYASLFMYDPPDIYESPWKAGCVCYAICVTLETKRIRTYLNAPFSSIKGKHFSKVIFIKK